MTSGDCHLTSFNFPGWVQHFCHDPLLFIFFSRQFILNIHWLWTTFFPFEGEDSLRAQNLSDLQDQRVHSVVIAFPGRESLDFAESSEDCNPRSKVSNPIRSLDEGPCFSDDLLRSFCGNRRGPGRKRCATLHDWAQSPKVLLWCRIRCHLHRRRRPWESVCHDIFLTPKKQRSLR